MKSYTVNPIRTIIHSKLFLSLAKRVVTIYSFQDEEYLKLASLARQAPRWRFNVESASSRLLFQQSPLRLCVPAGNYLREVEENQYGISNPKLELIEFSS